MWILGPTAPISGPPRLGAPLLDGVVGHGDAVAASASRGRLLARQHPRHAAAAVQPGWCSVAKSCGSRLAVSKSAPRVSTATASWLCRLS